MAARPPVIDADGHYLERPDDVRKYLKEPWSRRHTGLFPLNQPWDNTLFGTHGTQAIHGPMDPATEVAAWLRIMDEHDMPNAVLFPTRSGASSTVFRARNSRMRSASSATGVPPPGGRRQPKPQLVA